MGEADKNAMTKQEIYKSEQSNDKDIILYPEGKFYKAYERSAWRLCVLVHEFLRSVVVGLVPPGHILSVSASHSRVWTSGCQDGLVPICRMAVSWPLVPVRRCILHFRLMNGALSRYCQQDTWAIVEILRTVREKI